MPSPLALPSRVDELFVQNILVRRKGQRLSSCIPDEKILYVQDFGQGQKYCSDPDVLTLLF